MKIALIGVTGRVGSRLAAELLRRGHQVAGIARDLDKAAAREGLILKRGDTTNTAARAPLLANHHVVISAARFQTSDAKALIDAVKKAGVKRLLVVGARAALRLRRARCSWTRRISPTRTNPRYAPAGSEFLDALRQERDLDWTFPSPAAEFVPGERTGKFRLGNDRLLVGANGKSWISMRTSRSRWPMRWNALRMIRDVSRSAIDWGGRFAATRTNRYASKLR